MEILGVDPGSRITGYGIIKKDGPTLQFVTCGIIKTNVTLSFPVRLKELHDGLCEVIDNYNPHHAAVEDIFFARNAQSALKLGQARGALLVALVNAGITVHEFSPKLVKQAVTGYGQAAKGQIQQMVKVMLNLQKAPSEDAADALANAICLATHFDTY